MEKNRRLMLVHIPADILPNQAGEARYKNQNYIFFNTSTKTLAA